jgi:MFS family permease
MANGSHSIPAFVVVVAMLGGFGVISGITGPIRQAFINEYIPSAQRATVLSFDSFFADVGAVGGQLGFGALAQGASKALAYTVGGIIYLVGVPLYRRAGAAAHPQIIEPPSPAESCVGPAPCPTVPGETDPTSETGR